MDNLKRVIYFLIITFGLESFFDSAFAYNSLLSEGLNRVGWSFSSIFQNSYSIITIFFILYLFILYIIFKEVLQKISLFSGKEEIAKKLGLLLSIISTIGLFYYGYNGSTSINEFLVTYLGLPGLLGIIVFDIFIYKVVLETFNNFIKDSPKEIEKTLKMGMYGIIIGVSSLITLVYIEFLISNITMV